MTSIARCVLGLGVLALLGASMAGAQGGGNGTFYVGTYAKNILVIDEATMKTRDSIKLSIGIPYGFTLSFNRQRLYAFDPHNEKIEIVDIVNRKSLGSFTLSEGKRRVRMSGFNVDPLERFAVILIKTYTERADRYEIGKPTLVRYDLAKRAVTDTIPWPKGEERENAQIIFSPKGDLMYFFTTDDVLVYSTETLKEVDRFDLSRTLFEEGIGRLNFGFGNDMYEDPGHYTNLFRVTDPVNRRTMMGVARIDLVNRNVEYFYTLGPSAPVSFSLAPGRTRAFGLRQEVGFYQFWTYDLAGRRVARRVEFEGRPRMGMLVSTNGNQLYIGIAGRTIDRYDARTFALLGTTTLGADMTRMILVPAAAPPPRTGSASR
ncbi:MAG TPA: hypothetical protein VE869_14465 [Gemmatimonas sp.]|nr:hypothetical protein [Gemmatimonas sp.]